MKFFKKMTYLSFLSLLLFMSQAIFVDTKREVPEYVGNGMNCVNCHMDQGKMPNAAPLWGAYPMYSAYRSKNNKGTTYAERIQGCFEFSMNGTAPAA